MEGVVGRHFAHFGNKSSGWLSVTLSGQRWAIVVKLLMQSGQQWEPCDRSGQSDAKTTLQCITSASLLLPCCAGHVSCSLCGKFATRAGLEVGKQGQRLLFCGVESRKGRKKS